MEEKINLLCVIPTLGHGGAQKILVELAQHFSKEKKQLNIKNVSFLTLRNNDNNFYALNNTIDLHSLNCITGDNTTFRSIAISPFKFRKFVKAHKTDVIVSFQDISNFIVLIGTIGNSKLRIIVSERQDTRYYTLPLLRKHIRNLLYKRAHRIIVQTNLIADQFPKSLRKKISIIPNQIPKHTKQAQTLNSLSGKSFTIIAAGRLVDQKNFELLIEAATHLRQYVGKWKIDIYGTGSSFENLNIQIQNHRLEKLVSIHVPTCNILDKMADAHLFVLPSKYEGFPNVLAEAISCGLPSIAYDDVSGTADLITNGFNGLLLKGSDRTPQKLSQAIEQLISQPHLREQLSRNCSTKLLDFDEKRILEGWGQLLR